MREINLKNSMLKVIVDDDDYGFLSRFEWRINSCGYCVRSNDYASMHRMILGLERSVKGIDHKNRKKLDNRKSNLRKATATQNSANRAPKRDGKYKGVTYLPEKRKRKDSNGRVYYSPVSKRYRAMLSHGDKVFNLGCHETPEKAAMAYDKKAYELHGEFAYINLPTMLIKE